MQEQEDTKQKQQISEQVDDLKETKNLAEIENSEEL